MEQEDFNIREHQLTSKERDFENALRPLNFEDFSGQDKVVDNLRIFVKAARLRGERERRNHYAVFWANCPVDSFDTTRDAFCGVYGGPADPQAVRAGHCSGSIAHGWAPVGALHIHVTLAPGEEKKILFGLGYIENPQEKQNEKYTKTAIEKNVLQCLDQQETILGSNYYDQNKDLSLFILTWLYGYSQNARYKIEPQVNIIKKDHYQFREFIIRRVEDE